MPKRSRKLKSATKPKTLSDYLPRRDENQAAFDMVQQIIARTEATDGKDPLAVALGRRGGLKGGHARAAAMTKAERSASAKKAAVARWAKRKS
jgi:hypothetical protein